MSVSNSVDTAGSTPDIELRDVSFSFGSVPVLRHVTLSIYHNDFVAVIGPNGGGKTTLIKLMLGLLSPDEGSVRLLGGKPSDTCRKAGYMPQYSTGEKGFPITVFEMALLGRLGCTPSGRPDP